MNKRGVLFFILIVFSLSQVMPIMPVFAQSPVGGIPRQAGECGPPNYSCGDNQSCSLEGYCIPTPVGGGTAGDSCIDNQDCDKNFVCFKNTCVKTRAIGETLRTEYSEAFKVSETGIEPGTENDLKVGITNFAYLILKLLAVKVVTYTFANLVEAVKDWAPLGIPVGAGISIAFGGLDNLIDSLLVLWLNVLIIGIAVSLILWLGCVLLGWLFTLNCGIVASSVVNTGFGIILGLTNVGFVLALVVIAFATILRLKGYAMKNTLAKLLMAVLLINFSLFFIGLFLNVSNSITSAFLGREVCSVSADLPTQNTGTPAGTATEGPTEKKVGEFTLSYWKRFNLFSVFGAVEKSINQGKENFVIREFLLPIPNLFFATIISLIAAVNIIFLLWALIVRYVTLSILIIFSPLVWLSFIFPKLGGDLGNLWKEWWSTFIKWIIFLPIFSFFLYLVKLLLDNPGQLYNQGFLAYVGQLIVIIALLFGGLAVAKKMGIAGADKALAVAGAIGPALVGGAAGMAWRRISAGASARWARRPARRPAGPGGGRGGGAPPWWPRPWTGTGGTGGTSGGGGGRGGTPPPGGGPGPGGGGGTPGPGGTPGGRPRPGGGSPRPGGTPSGRPGGGPPGPGGGTHGGGGGRGGPPPGGGAPTKGTPPIPSSGPSPETFASPSYGEAEAADYFETMGEPSSIPPKKPTLETFTSPEYGAAEAADYFETMNGGESPSPAGSEERSSPVPGEGTPGGAPGGNDKDWEESFATWWDNESPSPAGSEEEGGPPPGDGGGAWWDNKLFRNVWRGVSTVTTPATSEAPEKRTFDTSIIKAVISAVKAELGTKHRAGAGEKEKEIKRLRAEKEAQKEEIERLESEERNRANGAS